MYLHIACISRRISIWVLFCLLKEWGHVTREGDFERTAIDLPFRSDSAQPSCPWLSPSAFKKTPSTTGQYLHVWFCLNPQIAATHRVSHAHSHRLPTQVRDP